MNLKYINHLSNFRSKLYLDVKREKDLDKRLNPCVPCFQHPQAPPHPVLHVKKWFETDFQELNADS